MSPALPAAPWPARRAVLRAAWPIILANAATPLLGLADTAVIGRYGTVEELGAIALGALIFNFLYWSFGFLRMGTTGFVAQASGRGDEAELQASIVRALLVAVAIAAVLMALQRPLELLSLELLAASGTVEGFTSDYFRLRIWDAPAALGLYCVMGALIGRGESRRLLLLQVFLNALNIGLDVLFAGPLGMGAEGVALGTVIATWLSLLLGLWLVGAGRGWSPDWGRVLAWERLRATFAVNGDIMLRTMLLLAGFAWFTNQGARFGDEVLAANHLLLQLISFCAFFLDGFAHVAESLVGKAKGRGEVELFDRALRRTSEIALATGLVLALLAWLLLDGLAGMLTDLPTVRALAGARRLELTVYIALSPWAFQLDGVFIGTTGTRALRNAAFGAVVSFVILSWWSEPWGNPGLWWAFVGFVVLRALFLGAWLPGLRRSIAEEGSEERPTIGEDDDAPPGKSPI